LLEHDGYGSGVVLAGTSGAERGLAPNFFEQEEAILDEVLLVNFVEGEHSWRPELDVSGKNSLRPIDQEERGLSSGLCGGSPDGLQDGLEVV
jgi:hypothetical protein